MIGLNGITGTFRGFFMRTGVTLVDITRAADELLAGGERPTVESIRKALGTGSPSTVNTLLKQYYQSLPARLNLPAPIATAAAELYEKIRSAAADQVAEERAELERRVAQEREQVAQERRGFEREKSDLRAQVLTLGGDVERLREQNRGQAARISQLEKELSTATARASAAESQARAAEDERERTGQKHANELQRLKEQSEGNERHLLLRLDELKTQHQRQLADRDRAATATLTRISALETTTSEGVKLNASLRGELATLQRDLAKRHDAAVAAENALTRSQEQLVKERLAHENEVERLQSQMGILTTIGEQLKRERDDAMREASRQEGKTLAFQAELEAAKDEIRRLQVVKPREAAAGS